MKLLDVAVAALLLPSVSAQAVETVKVAAGTVARQSRLPGELLPYLEVELRARVTAFVESVEVDRGSIVAKDQLLARLSAPEMAAQLAEAEAKVQAVESQRAEAEAKLVAAASTYERLKAAAATPGVVAGNELVLAEKAVEAARALVKSLESSAAVARNAVKTLKELEAYLEVRAPFDGIITERRVHPGALVGPGGGATSGPMLVLQQVARLRLVVPVPETEVAGMRRGARITFKVPAHPDRTFTGTLARVPHSIEPKTRTMPVELDVTNTGGLLAPGMYPEVGWPVRRPRPSLLVPPTSIATTTERSFVIRVRDGKAEWVDVTKGMAMGELVEVFGELKAGEVIVKRASDEIREGTLVAGR